MRIGTQRADILNGGSGPDVLIGLAGNDIVNGGSGNDLLLGNAGSDILRGGSGADTLRGGPGSDILAGGSGNDMLAGGAGGDILTGGSGRDTASFADAARAVTADLRDGVATEAQGGRDTLSGIENLQGSLHADTLSGNVEANRLFGDVGADILTGRGGADTFAYSDRVEFGDTITDFRSGVDRLEFTRANVFPVAADAPPPGPLPADAFFVGAAPHDASDRFVFNPATHVLSFDADGTGPLQTVQVATLPGATVTAGDIFLV